MEGISQEAIALAGHLKLNRLIVLFDDNGISIDGPLSLVGLGRPGEALRGRRLGRASASTGTIRRRSPPRSRRRKASDRPTMIACKTTIGFGAPTKAGSEKSHGSPLGADEIEGAREKLGWTHAPFEVPGRHSAAPGARPASARKAARKAWDKRLAALAADRARRIRAPHATATCRRRSPTRCARVKEKLAAEPKDIATRASSEFALESLDRRRCRKWSAARPTSPAPTTPAPRR